MRNFPVLAALALLPLTLNAQETAPFQAITEAQDAAIEKGIAWLAKNQNKNGSWGSHGQSGQYPMAMTGLAGLALLSAGHTPGRGAYGQHVDRAVEFCLKSQDRGSGLLTTPQDGQSMYGHGFAMTFLAEACGMDLQGEQAPKILDCLARAAKLTARAQSSWGGWYYSPNSGSDEGSVTITQVQALRASANIGVVIPPKVMQNALSYIHKSQNDDGGVRYTARSGGSSSVALSAAGTELLLMAGQYEVSETKKAIAYLKRNLSSKSTQGYHDFYTNFYGTQAMMQIGGKDFEKYYEDIRHRLLKSQQNDGRWEDGVGPVYATSIGVMILAMPYTYLPIFQK